MTCQAASRTTPGVSALVPPHDPNERECVWRLGRGDDEWEVRIFSGRFFEYFVPRGLWHVQLWNPRARVSILTPSKLTAGAWEAFPIRAWKARRDSWSGTALAVAAEHAGVTLPDARDVAWVEETFVRGLARTRGASPTSAASSN